MEWIEKPKSLTEPKIINPPQIQKDNDPIPGHRNCTDKD